MTDKKFAAPNYKLHTLITSILIHFSTRIQYTVFQ